MSASQRDRTDLHLVWDGWGEKKGRGCFTGGKVLEARPAGSLPAMLTLSPVTTALLVLKAFRVQQSTGVRVGWGGAGMECRMGAAWWRGRASPEGRLSTGFEHQPIRPPNTQAEEHLIVPPKSVYIVSI